MSSSEYESSDDNDVNDKANINNKNNLSVEDSNESDCSEEVEEDSEEESEEEEDEDTNKIKALTEQVYNYDEMTENDKIKSIDEYKSIIASIKDLDGVISEYKEELTEIDETDNSKKIITNSKTFTKNMKRFVEIKDDISENSYTVKELLELYKELKLVQQRLVSYLKDKKVEIVNI